MGHHLLPEVGVLAKHLLKESILVLRAQHVHIVRGRVQVVVLPVHDLLEVEHDQHANHSMAVENISQTAVSTECLHEGVLLDAECLLDGGGCESHHGADHAGDDRQNCQVDLGFSDL